MSKTSILVIRFYSTCCFKNVNHFFTSQIQTI